MSSTKPLDKPQTRKREKIAADLREMARTLTPGARLPSVPDMKRHYGVATGTVEAAIETLRQEGLITRRRGAGTFVSDSGGAAPAASASDVRSDAVAVLAAASGGGFSNYVRNLLEEVSRQACGGGGRVVHHVAPYDPAPRDELHTLDSETTLRHALELEALRPRGYILTFYDLDSVAKALIERGHRAVVVGVPPAGVLPAVPVVFGDHEQGGYLVARHLIENGHRRLLFVHSFRDEARLLGSRRWAGYCRALREAGFPGAPEHAAGYAMADDGALLRERVARPDGPTGLAFWTDDLALLALKWFRDAGLRVPEDVSVVGYDNVYAGAPGGAPRLDSVDQHLDTQVRYALSLLDTADRGDGNAAGGATPMMVVAPTLVERGSVAKPRDVS